MFFELSCNNIASNNINVVGTTSTSVSVKMSGASGQSNTLKCGNSLQTPKEVTEIRLNLENDWKVLRSVHQMLVDEKAFCANPNEWNEKIVHFVQPEELQVSDSYERTRSNVCLQFLCRPWLCFCFHLKKSHNY